MRFGDSLDELENPWPALADLLAATTLLFLVLFAVIAVPALKRSGKAMQLQNTLATLTRSLSRSFKPQTVGDYLLIRIPGDAVFQKDSASIGSMKALGKSQLLELAALIKTDSILDKIDQIHIVGHTSREGPDLHNWELSSSRATNVAYFLITEAKLPPCKVTALGRGRYYPIQPTRSDVNEADRRIEIEIRPVIIGDSAQKLRRAECVDGTTR